MWEENGCAGRRKLGRKKYDKREKKMRNKGNSMRMNNRNNTRLSLLIGCWDVACK